MADDSIQINSLEQGQDACNRLKSATQKIDVARQSASSSFAALSQINPDLGSNFISELKNSLDDIFTYLNGKVPKAENYFKNEDSNNNGNNKGGNNNRGGNYGGGGIDPVPDTTPEETAVAAVNLSDINTTPLTESQLSDLNGLVDEIIELTKQKNSALDTFVETDVNSDLIKQMLLESPHVPEEFKAVIKDLDSSAVRLLLGSILKGNIPEIFELNTLNLGVTLTYLADIADQNGITITDLLENEKYSSLLKSSLTEFDDVVELIKGWEDQTPEEFQKQMKQFYFGDVSTEFPDQDILVTRTFVDYLADASNAYYEDLLDDTSYASVLKDGALELGKALTFFNATSLFTDQGMKENMTSLMYGSNYEAYGMTKENVESFKKEIDSAAKEKNVSVNDYLTDSKYADEVKEVLLKSKSAEDVGLIYKKLDSSISQKVSKNLYETKYEKSKQQEELDKILEEKAKKEAEAKAGEENK